jgi:hypothetical protein
MSGTAPGTAPGTATALLPQKAAPVSGTALLPPIEREQCRAGAASLWGVGERCRSPTPRAGGEPAVSVLARLESRCPELVDYDRWQQCVDDGRAFLSRWGEQAEAFGWTSKDLFGLHKPPERPHPSYRRLSRYDETGLIWLLDGRRVVALTENTAAIQNPATGLVTTYRRHNKPALGPLGDSLNDLIA